MKKIMLTALGLCLAFFSRTASADNTSITDTIIIIPNDQVKILILGNSLTEIAEYTSSDSVIALLLSDVDAGSSNPDFPKNSFVTHYFIHESGRRRLKAESEDFVEPEINIFKEIESLNLSLPPHLYHIHDLARGIELKIYISNPEMLNTLKLFRVSEALVLVRGDKKTLRRHYRIDISRQSDAWSVVNKVRFNVDQIQLTTSFGIGLLGNKWSPTSDLSLYLMFTDKHGNPRFKTGVSASYFAFFDQLDEKLTGFYSLSMYRAGVKFNYSSEGRAPRWVGIAGGIVQSSVKNPFHNKPVMSITSELVGPFSLSLDFIRFEKNKSVSGVSILFNF